MQQHNDSEARSEEVPPDSEFESYFDRDSGAWSLRRIPSTPPQMLADDEETA